MTDIAKKSHKFTTADKSKHGEGKARPVKSRSRAVTTSNNPTMKRFTFGINQWKCIECGKVYVVDRCAYCDNKNGRVVA